MSYTRASVPYVVVVLVLIAITALPAGAQQDPPRGDCCFHIYSVASNLGWASSLLDHTQIRTRLEPADEVIFRSLFTAGQHVEAACKTCSRMNPAWLDWTGRQQYLEQQANAIRQRPDPIIRGQVASSIRSTSQWGAALRVRIYNDQKYEADTCAEKYFQLGFLLGYAQQTFAIGGEWLQSGRNDWMQPVGGARAYLQEALRVLDAYTRVDGCTNIRDLNLGGRISGLIQADGSQLGGIIAEMGATWQTLQQRLIDRCDSGTGPPPPPPGGGGWVATITSGVTFYVVFDRTADKFNDESWLGAQDPLGTLKGGTTYTVVYRNGGFTCTGYNEGLPGVGTWTYSNADPNAFQVSLWNVVFTFNEQGELYHPVFGLVGHLSRQPR